MLAGIRNLVDGEEQHLARIPMGRQKFLRTLGVGLFGFATTLIMPKTAFATHQPISCPCTGRKCHCCNSQNECCETPSCPSTGYCWYAAGGTPECPTCAVWECCDYTNPSNDTCVCMKKTCNCC